MQRNTEGFLLSVEAHEVEENYGAVVGEGVSVAAPRDIVQHGQQARQQTVYAAVNQGTDNRQVHGMIQHDAQATNQAQAVYASTVSEVLVSQAEPQPGSQTQTMYAALAPATIATEQGYQQVYVTVEQHPNVGSYPQQISQAQPGLQPVVTVTVPGAQGSGQPVTLRESSSMLIQEQPVISRNTLTIGHGTSSAGHSSLSNTTKTETNVTSHTSTVSNSGKQHDVSSEQLASKAVSKVESHLPEMLPKSSTHQIMHLPTSATNGSDQNILLQDLLSKCQWVLLPSTSADKVSTQASGVPQLRDAANRATALPITATAVSTPHTQPLVAEVPTKEQECERQKSKEPVSSNVETILTAQDGATRSSVIKEIFSSVTATLSDDLMEVIPGAKTAFLQQMEKEHHVHLQHDNNYNHFVLKGDLHNLVSVENKLREMFHLKRQQVKMSPVNAPSGGTVESPMQGMCADEEHVTRTDKAVLCDILKPQFSRSGREVKQTRLDFGEEDPSMFCAPDEKVKSRRKSKRGRKTRLEREKQDLVKGIKIKNKSPCSDSGGTTDQSSQVLETLVAVVKQEATSSPSVSCTRLTSGKPDEKDTQPAKAEQSELMLQSSEAGEHLTKPQEEESVKQNNIENDDPHEDGDSNSDVRDPIYVCPVTESTSTCITELPPPKKKKKDYEALAPYKFFCTQCSFKSKRESHFKKHQMLHEKNPALLYCSKCNFSTMRLGHLRRHEISHSEELYKCLECKYTTDSVKLLSRHCKIKHNSSPSRGDEAEYTVYECSTCDYKTKRVYQFKRHLKCHMDTSAEGQIVSSFQCPLCSYKSTRKEHFLRHMSNVHGNKRPHLCDLCGKSFKRTDTLRQHRVVHLDKSDRSYNFKCPTCFKGFRSQAHLREHCAIHTNVRSYLCEICGASFKTRSVQRRHVLSIHCNPRAHSCQECDKKFNTRYALRRHLRTHDTPGMRSLQQAGSLQQAVLTLNEGQTLHVISPGDPMVQDLQAVATEQNVVAVADTQQITTDDMQAATAIEETYEAVNVDDSNLKQLQPTAYIQTNEAGTALLYLTNFQTM